MLRSIYLAVFALSVGAMMIACSNSHTAKVDIGTQGGNPGGGGGNPTTSGKDWGVSHGFPAIWWETVDPKLKADWEILPQEAKPGEVILSKRNNLGKLLSNFGATPFTLRGKTYASIEGFWQATKYPEGPGDVRLDPKVVWKFTRSQVEQMTSFEAKDAGKLASDNMAALQIDWVSFEGTKMIYREQGESEFYHLIRSTMISKLLQNPDVYEILKKTKTLKLRPDHEVKATEGKAWHFYSIWMELRDQILAGVALENIQ